MFGINKLGGESELPNASGPFGKCPIDQGLNDSPANTLHWLSRDFDIWTPYRPEAQMRWERCPPRQKSQVSTRRVNVGGEWERLTAGSGDLVGESCKRGFASRHQGDLSTHLQEGQREVAADAAGGPTLWGA
jgi:hypothetical protein